MELLLRLNLHLLLLLLLLQAQYLLLQLLHHLCLLLKLRLAGFQQLPKLLLLLPHALALCIMRRLCFVQHPLPRPPLVLQPPLLLPAFVLNRLALGLRTTLPLCSDNSLGHVLCCLFDPLWRPRICKVRLCLGQLGLKLRHLGILLCMRSIHR